MDTTPSNDPVSSQVNPSNLESSPPLWNPSTAGAWSLIFNPVFGSILILMNWQALDNKEKIRGSQIWLALSVIVLLAVLFLPLPSPFGSVISLTYLLIWYFSSAKQQANYIQEKWGKNYAKRSWLWPLVIAIVVMVILYGSIFFLSFVNALLS